MKEKNVTIVEIGPRDGFQSVPAFIPTKEKIRIIDQLLASGVDALQCTSFINPKAIPQMKDALEVAEHCVANYDELDIFALTPNIRGIDNAVRAGLEHVTLVMSLSETHNRKNINRSHEESFSELKEALEKYPNLKIDIDIATVFGCPFEGVKTYSDLYHFVLKLAEIGATDINLCDTIGVSFPSQVKEFVRRIQVDFPKMSFSVHIHDTRNMGMMNSLTAIENGITTVQTTIGGLGGCPFAPGATGNTATEDLNYMLLKEGYSTGIDQEKLLDVAKMLPSIINGGFSGHHMEINTVHPDFK